MASPPVFNIDRLVAPIPGDDPAGIELPWAVSNALDEARKEGDPFGPPKKRDWPLILQLGTDTLADKSKDFLVATRVTEAATFLHGFVGLRDGLTLMARLIGECWDRIRPVPGDGESVVEVRGGPLLWLNDANNRIRFPFALKAVPLFTARGEDYSVVEWKSKRAAFDAAVGTLKPPDIEKFKVLMEDLKEVRPALEQLGKVVDEKMKELDLDLINGSATIGAALAEVQDIVNSVAKKLKIGDAPPPGAAAAAAGTPGAAAGPAQEAPVMNTRDDLYRQIEVISEALQRIEPHSPIPFLLKRAVKLGNMPFPQLMRAIMEETKALDAMDKMLGIEKEGKGKPKNDDDD